MKNEEIKFAFLGTSEFSVYVLDELKKSSILPSLIITVIDKPKGRNLVLTPPPVKVWAEENGIRVIQPEKLNEDLINELESEGWDVFIVASNGKIIPKSVLEIPKQGSLNVHPSLLPELRGPSPLQTMILEDKKDTGVTILLVDEKMDHGPIVVQEEVTIDKWSYLSVLEEQLAKIGGKMLVDVLSKWISGKIKPVEQDHSKATFSKMLQKEDSLIDLDDDDYLNYRKIMAYERLRPHFFKDGKRIVINSADFVDGKLKILRVTPEGKKEIDYSLL